MEPPNRLTFAWWNLHDFAHYDAERAVEERWPNHPTDYEAKRDRIMNVLRDLSHGDFPDLFAACEITREAARDLVGYLPSGFDVSVAPVSPHSDDFQVAIFYRTGIGLSPEAPLLPGETRGITRESRPMVPVHLSLPGHVIRFVACHWTGFGEDSSRTARGRLADFLRNDLCDFLDTEEPASGAARHIIVLGDLNDEPMSDLFKDNIDGRRDRRTARKSHWRDEDVGRVRLYNLAWRYLGEQVPHASGRPATVGPVGTWYNDKKGWRTHDHVLVSGGLLGEDPPYIDEENTRILSLPILHDKDGLPTPFDPVEASGVSDHLPIAGQLILPGTSQ